MKFPLAVALRRAPISGHGLLITGHCLLITLLFLSPCVLAPAVRGQIYLNYYFDNIQKPIPDNNPNGVTDLRSITAPEPGLIITDVNVELTLSGATAANGDLYATLQHDQGFSVLLNRPGRAAEFPLGYGDNGLSLRLDDAAANGDIHHYRTAIFGNPFTPLGGPLSSADTGAWAPDGREVDPSEALATHPRTAGLSSFNGLSLDGSWQLFVADLAQTGHSILEKWALEIAVVPGTSNTGLDFQNATVRADEGERALSNPVALGGTVRVKGDGGLTLSGQLSGSGALVKTGGGKMVLEGANTFRGGISLSEGTLAIGNDRALGLGSLEVQGGVIEAAGGSRVVSNPLTLSGDVVFGGAHALEFAGSAALAGPRQFAVNNTTVFSGQITDDALQGSLTKSGGGVLQLDAANTFSGGITLEEGTLSVGNDQALGTGPLNLEGGSLRASGGARTISNPVNLKAAATFTGEDPLTFGGTTKLETSAALSVGGNVTFAGAIEDGPAPAQLTKTGSGTLTLSGANTFSGGVQLQEGVLRISNTTGSATGSGQVDVGGGGKLIGNGLIGGRVKLKRGGVIGPGASPGAITTGDTIWESGAVYQWEINQANGAAGLNPGWDLWNIDGTLGVTAVNADKFIVQVISLTLDDTPGAVHDFNSLQPYTWVIASATAGLTGFAPDTIHLDLTAFQGELRGGSFNLIQSDNTIAIHFIPVPEPHAGALACAALLLTFAAWRRHRSAAGGAG